MSNEGIKKIFVTPLDAVDTSDKEGVGVLRFEGGKVYKYVKYKEGTGTLDIAVGDVVYWLDYDNGEVTADLSDTNEVGAGVSAGAVTETDRFFWIQVAGLATLNTDVTAGTVGDALTATGAGDKTLDVSALVTDAVVAVLEDATASAQKIHCMFPW